MRVATLVGIALNRATRDYEREASWRFVADTLRLDFSTGFTTVNFVLGPTGGDAFQGRVSVWNDDGAITYPGGAATLSVVPCSRIALP